MPVRGIRKSHTNVTGILASRKARGIAKFASVLECDLLTLLEFDPAVQEFEVEPVKIPWNDPMGEDHTYIPDCLSWPTDTTTPPTLYEVKYREKFWNEWPTMRNKYRAAVHDAACKNIRFQIVTEEEIRSVYLHNARFLLSFVLRVQKLSERSEILLSTLAEQSPTTPGRLLSSITQDPIERAFYVPRLWQLIGTFRIGADLWQSLTMESKIWAIGKDQSLECPCDPDLKLRTWADRRSLRGTSI